MFSSIKQKLGQMKDLGFWKGLLLKQGKDLLKTFVIGKLEQLITEFLIKKPMLAAERLRRKNGYAPSDHSLFKKMVGAMLGI